MWLKPRAILYCIISGRRFPALFDRCTLGLFEVNCPATFSGQSSNFDQYKVYKIKISNCKRSVRCGELDSRGKDVSFVDLDTIRLTQRARHKIHPLEITLGMLISTRPGRMPPSAILPILLSLAFDISNRLQHKTVSWHGSLYNG